MSHSLDAAGAPLSETAILAAMRTPMLALAIATCLACGKPATEPAAAERSSANTSAPSGKTREEQADGLVLIVPEEWQRAPGSSSMRKAEFVLSGSGGEARLVVYRFQGGAGSATQNIDRWVSQIEPKPGGEPKTSELQANGLRITSLEAAGRFAGQSMPGMPAQPPIEDARLLAAAIEGSGDPYYLKLVGPAATIEPWVPAWNEMLSKLAVAQ
jgi:hypothetical protein